MGMLYFVVLFILQYLSVIILKFIIMHENLVTQNILDQAVGLYIINRYIYDVQCDEKNKNAIRILEWIINLCMTVTAEKLTYPENQVSCMRCRILYQYIKHQ